MALGVSGHAPKEVFPTPSPEFQEKNNSSSPAPNGSYLRPRVVLSDAQRLATQKTARAHAESDEAAAGANFRRPAAIKKKVKKATRNSASVTFDAEAILGATFGRPPAAS